ncbi:Clp protease N-terminal domain-containing protein, partial [uncultured Porphyromonas sp.]|uniref:Clp protease N-terminal domain-containing protein n=1 Tax=uncultured Porphyromonas sp. TaxID=159274 RepID=UPI0026315846
MNWEKYTTKSQEIIQAAIESAKGNGQQAIEALHLLQALLNGGGHLIEKSIPEAGGDISRLR